MDICSIVAPESGVYSETFIRDHIEKIPCKVVPVYGNGRHATFASSYICSRLTRYMAAAGKLQHVPASVSALAMRWTDKALAAFWRTHHIEAILAEYANTAAWVSQSARMAGVPLVVHFHGYDIYRRDILDKYKTEYAELFRTAEAFIVGSRDMLDHVIRLGVPPSRLHYNPCGVDVTRFKQVDAGKNPPTIAAIGRFVDKKAPYATILAFQKARVSCPEARLIMVGDGILFDACQQMATCLGLNESIEFRGRANHDEVAKVLQGARAFAQHSVTALSGDSEGTSISVLEAAACGLPVLATRHAGIKDTMIDGVTGFLVDELDVNGMAENMRQVLIDPSLATELGANARKRVAENFTMERSIAGIHSVLQAAAAGSRG